MECRLLWGGWGGVVTLISLQQQNVKKKEGVRILLQGTAYIYYVLAVWKILCITFYINCALPKLSTFADVHKLKYLEMYQGN